MGINACCFTGHRKITPHQAQTLSTEIENTIHKLIEEGVTHFLVGGALGFDTLCAQAVIAAKKSFPHIQLALILPCRSQALYWNQSDIYEYENIKSSADEIRYVSENHTKSCMFVRNRFLVDNSSICVCYLEKEKGGTAYTVQYAQSKGLRIINLFKTQANKN